jgi:phage baseplate assembly protein W
MTATRTFSDLDLNFQPHPVTGDVVKVKNENAIVTSVKNLLLTNFYERPFNPQIGSNINNLLFELLDGLTAGAIAEDMKTVIRNFEPRVQVDSVNVTPDYDNNGFNVTMEFFIVNNPEPITINFFLERTR